MAEKLPWIAKGVVTMMETPFDIRADVRQVITLLEEDDEEEEGEDDA